MTRKIRDLQKASVRMIRNARQKENISGRVQEGGKYSIK
jgi:hypothetical protein